MKLIKKINSYNSNIIVDKHYLYYQNQKKLLICFNLINNNIIWKSFNQTDGFGVTNDYYYEYWDDEYNEEYFTQATFFIKKDFKKLFNIKFEPIILFKNNFLLVDFSTTKKPDLFGLFDIDKREVVWQNDRDIPYEPFIKGDYYYTLEDMRLERINGMTGELMWSISTEVEIKFNEDPQKIIDEFEGYLVMSYDYNKIVGIDINTGEIAWEWIPDDIQKKIKDFEFSSYFSDYIEYENGKYYFGYEDKLLSIDLVQKKIDIVIDGEVEIRGRRKEMVFHELFKCGDKMCFYGTKYSRELGAHYSVIGVYDMAKKMVVDFADDEFPGPLRFKPAIYKNMLFQQDDDGDIHVFELEI